MHIGVREVEAAAYEIERLQAKLVRNGLMSPPAKKSRGSASRHSSEWLTVHDKKPKPVGRPPSGKIMVNLRLDPEVVAKFKAAGPGWQARINEALRKL